MRTITGTYTSVVAFDAYAWKQERLLLSFNGLVSSESRPTAKKVRFWASGGSSFASPIAIYTLDANYKCTIDVSDYIRTYGGFGDSYNLYLAQETSTGTQLDLLTIPYVVVGLINPASVVIPAHELTGTGAYDAVIVPPHKLIQAGSLLSGGIVCEWRPNSGGWTLTQYDTTGTQISAGTSSSPSMTLSASAAKLLLTKSSTITRALQPQKCGTEYAAVEWVSFSGATRRHVLEVVKKTTAAADNYALMTADNSYNEVKGRVDGMTLRIDGLDAYDYWYYADMLTSSKVRVCLDGTNWAQVQVTTKNATMPDGNAGNGKVEITINWKRYDAVAL